jgi:hypothetical protein
MTAISVELPCRLTPTTADLTHQRVFQLNDRFQSAADHHGSTATGQRKRTFTCGLERSIIDQQLSSLQPRLTDRVLSMNEHQSYRSDCKRRNLLCLEFCGDVLLNPYLICVPARGQPGDEDGRTSSRYFVGS